MPADTIGSGRTFRPHPVNLRDLGGTPTRDGAAIHQGRLLRSDDLATVAPREVAALLGDIGLVVDLRSDLERELFGVARLPARTERLHTAMTFGEMPTGADLAADPSALPSTPEEFGRLYADGVRDNAMVLRRTLERIAEQPRGTLVHCVAGKDRTGVLIALLLTAAEVPRHLIVEDYAATAANMPALLASAGGHLGPRPAGGEPDTNGTTEPATSGVDLSSLAAQLPSVLFDAPAAAMQTCLDELDDSHGSPLGPLRDAGLDASVEAALRCSLIQDG